MNVGNYTIVRYNNAYFEDWNQFVENAKNATFLFNRNYMEYHNKRFDDFSLMVFDDKENLAALFPANRLGNKVYSHQGLTYGGLLFSKKIKLAQTLLLFKKLLQFLYDNEIETLQVKEIPFFYCTSFCDELKYLFYLTDARIVRSDSLSTIQLQQPYFISKTRKESIRRGNKNKLSIREDYNFDLFWSEILIPNLDKKHQVKPVHTVDEIKLLHKRFPNNIRHFNVYHNDKIVAGTTVYVTSTVVHPQYVSGNEDKNELGSIDYLYHYLISTVFADKMYFDFGISNEENGKKLNTGLLFWKESFGAKTVVQNFYEVATKNYTTLDTVLI